MRSTAILKASAPRASSSGSFLRTLLAATIGVGLGLASCKGQETEDGGGGGAGGNTPRFDDASFEIRFSRSTTFEENPLTTVWLYVIEDLAKCAPNFKPDLEVGDCKFWEVEEPTECESVEDDPIGAITMTDGEVVYELSSPIEDVAFNPNVPIEIDAKKGPEIGAFNVTTSLPGDEFQMTAPVDGFTQDLSKDLVVTWSGAGDVVVVEMSEIDRHLRCEFPGKAGRGTINKQLLRLLETDRLYVYAQHVNIAEKDVGGVPVRVVAQGVQRNVPIRLE